MTLGVLPGDLPVDVRPTGRSGFPTFDISVTSGSGCHEFLAGWAGAGWPSDVERLLQSEPDIEVVYARRLSEGATSLLAERHLSWIDGTGRANIVRPSGLVIVREPSVAEERPMPEHRWTKTMVAAVEAIFSGVPPTVEAVEAVAEISRGASANALSRLEHLGLLERPAPKRGPNASRRVVDEHALLDAYAHGAAEFRKRQKVIRLHRLWDDPITVLDTEIGPALTRVDVRWAVTGAVASTLLAPYLSDVTVVELYVDHSLFVSGDSLARVLGARVVEKGHRIEVRELPTSISASGPRIGSVQVALPARVYADLVASGGRAEEAAHHLREVRGVGSHS